MSRMARGIAGRIIKNVKGIRGLVRAQQTQEAARKYLQTQTGRKFSAEREANQRGAEKQAQRELEEIRKIMNEDGHLLEMNRNNLPAAQKEIFDLRMLYFEALAKGEIRNMKDFHQYLQRWLVETHQDPKSAQYADVAIKKLIRSFNPIQRKKLEKRIENLAILAKGGDPYE